MVRELNKADWIVIFFTWSLIIGAVCWGLFANHETEEVNEFCSDNGFKEATDSKIFRCQDDNKRKAMIECDGEKIFNTIGEKICLYENKWGQCIQHISGNFRVSSENC